MDRIELLHYEPNELVGNDELVVQISFSAKTDLKVIEEGLTDLVNMLPPNTIFLYGGLSWSHIKEAELDSGLLDMVERIIGPKRLILPSVRYKSYDEAMENMDKIRLEISKLASKTYVIGADSIPYGIAREIELASNGKVFFLFSRLG